MSKPEDVKAFNRHQATAHTIEMTVDEWIGVPENPRQRDTEHHLRRARHLLVPSPTHQRVAMALCTDGKRWKLDGHTRALAWARHMVPRPDKIIVSVYPVSTQLEAEELYTQFDAAEAVETAGDKVFGAYRSHGWAPNSKLLRQGGISTACKIAQGCAEGMRTPSRDHIASLIGAWLGEIKTFDQISPDAKRFTSPLMAAAMMTFRRFPGDAMAYEFWEKYNLDAGEKVENAMDPVEALSRFMMSNKGDGAKHSRGGPYDVLGKGLAAMKQYRARGTYTRSLVSIDPTRFLEER